MKYGICDKCREEVPYENSCLALESSVVGRRFLGFYSDRHIFQTEKCEGSPSRRLMIENDSQWKAAYECIKAGEGKPEWVK